MERGYIQCDLIVYTAGQSVICKDLSSNATVYGGGALF